MKNLKKNAIYLLLVIPTITEWLESGHLPSDVRAIITDLSMTVLVFILILISRKKDKKIHSLRQEVNNKQMFDPLTGVPLRERFIKDLDLSIANAKIEEGKV